MSLGDLPSIPRKYKPRVRKLFEKIQSDEISMEQILTNVFSSIGKVSVNAGGINATGDYGTFGFDKRIIADGREALVNACDLITVVLFKSFLIKRGEEFTKVFIGPGLWQTPARPEDIKNKRLPIFEIKKAPEQIFKEKFLNAFHVYLDTPLDKWQPASKDFKIHRMEQLAGWLGNDWGRFGKLLRVIAPMADLSTKEALDKINASMDPLCDQVLTKCGV